MITRGGSPRPSSRPPIASSPGPATTCWYAPSGGRRPGQRLRVLCPTTGLLVARQRVAQDEHQLGRGACRLGLHGVRQRGRERLLQPLHRSLVVPPLSAQDSLLQPCPRHQRLVVEPRSLLHHVVRQPQPVLVLPGLLLGARLHEPLVERRHSFGHGGILRRRHLGPQRLEVSAPLQPRQALAPGPSRPRSRCPA